MIEMFAAFVLGLASSTIAAIAAGGGLISVPGMMLLGLTPVQAIATTRLNLLAGGTSSSLNYYRNKSISFSYLPYFIIISIIAGFVGPKLLVHLDQNMVKDIIGLSFLITLPLLVFDKKFGIKNHHRSLLRKIEGFVVFFLIMSYGTMIGAGAGVLTIYVLVYYYGMNITRANATGLVANMVATSIAIVAFIHEGEVVWRLGLPSMAGAFIGGYIGSRLAIDNGIKWVKSVLAAVVLIAALTLLLL